MIDFLSFLRLLIFMAHFLPSVLDLLFHASLVLSSLAAPQMAGFFKMWR